MELYKEKLTQYKKRNGELLSQKSQDHYYRTIKGLVDKNGFDWRISKLKEFLQSFETPTKLSYVNSVINYLTIMGYTQNQMSPYKKYKEDLEKEKENKPIVNPKKENNLAEWNEILDWRNKLFEMNKDKSMWNFKYNEVMLELILELYTTFPRRNEIADLKFQTTKDDTEDNYILDTTDTEGGDMRILFNDYKTAHKYGKQEYVIPPNTRLYDLINIFTELNWHRYHMFYSPRDNNVPLTRLNLTKMLQRSSKKHIGKSVSTDRIRKAYAGQNKEAIAQIENTSEMLSHSVGTNIKHYNVKK